jgi:hypothetical protein
MWPAPNTGVGIRLLDVAAGCAGAARDREQRGHAAVGRAVGVSHEPRFTNRAVQRDEGWNAVGSTALSGERNLRIDCRARPADRRLRMATAAAVQVHPRSQALVDLFRFIEVLQAQLEKFGLVVGEAGNGPAGGGRTAAQPRVPGPVLGLQNASQTHQDAGGERQREWVLIRHGYPPSQLSRGPQAQVSK